MDKGWRNNVDRLPPLDKNYLIFDFRAITSSVLLGPDSHLSPPYIFPPDSLSSLFFSSPSSIPMNASPDSRVRPACHDDLDHIVRLFRDNVSGEYADISEYGSALISDVVPSPRFFLPRGLRPELRDRGQLLKKHPRYFPYPLLAPQPYSSLISSVCLRQRNSPLQLTPTRPPMSLSTSSSPRWHEPT